VAFYSGHIGTLRPEGVRDRLEPTGLVVEVAEFVVHEGDEPDPIAHLFHADVLSSKHLTQVDLAALVTDAAAVRDGTWQALRGAAT
jgi:hypothetical protein